jgi:hypothetical protein
MPPDHRFDRCGYCAEHPDELCRYCHQRARRVAMQFEGGVLTLGQLAERLGISPLRILALVESHLDYREERALRADSGPVETAFLRRVVRRWQARDPQLRTLTELAERAGYRDQKELGRALGMYATSPVRVDGRYYPPKLKTALARQPATRLLQAMGYAPCDFAGF